MPGVFTLSVNGFCLVTISIHRPGKFYLHFFKKLSGWGPRGRCYDQARSYGRRGQLFGVGLIEGFNNKIKVVKRRCYGIFNIQHLRHRILLDTLGG